MISASEEQVAEGKANDDGDEDAAVEGHNGKHEEVFDGRVQPEDHRPGESRRTPGVGCGLRVEEWGSDGGRRRGSGCRGGGEKFEAEAAIFHVLVEDGDDEAGA